MLEYNSHMEVYNSNTLVNLANSILKVFNVETFHETIPEIDKYLKGHKKIVLVLFDGMGQNITRMHLKEDSFIRSHYVHTINSTYPPTTAAATTSVLTGKFPIETGWLAWATYFPEVNRNVILFRGYDYNTGEKIDPEIAYKKYPNKQLFELIKEADKDAKTFCLQRFPIQQYGPKSLISAGKMIKKELKNNEKAFGYFYWDTPDVEMHANGIYSPLIRRKVRRIDRFMKKLTKANPDTLFILTADHGHVNTEYIDIPEYPDLYSLISKPACLEKRSPSFFVKEGKENEFKELFNKYFGNEFDLLSKEEVLKYKLFGEGKPRDGVIDSFGDFVALSKGKYSLYSSKEYKSSHKGKGTYPGHHGGGTKEERLIDISIYNH